MTSSDLVSRFAAAGLAVRVRDLGQKFRVCPRSSAPYTAAEKVAAVELAKSLGLTDALGRSGGNFNGGAEFIAYKPGAVVRVART